MDFLRKVTACLNAHTSGTAGEFLRWADEVWQSSVDKGKEDFNAAELLIGVACK